MTPDVGQALREARTDRGIELSDVERVTRIRIKFLRAMEEDRWEALPAPAYARGFLSAYARFLGLDDEQLLDQYRRSAERDGSQVAIPAGVLKPGTVKRRRSLKAVAMLLAGLVAAAVVGLPILGSLGGSDSGGDQADQRARTAAGSGAKTTSAGEKAVAPAGPAPSGQGSEVSLQLHSTGTVWVCLVDDRGRVPVNGETLTADELRGPFDGREFEVTFGNGSVEMTVDGAPVEIPPVAEPLGYRITADEVRTLDPSAQPTCL